MFRFVVRDLRLIFLFVAFVALVVVACGNDDTAPTDGDADSDGDLDYNPFDPVDGDNAAPDTQPEPQGDPVLDIIFGQQANGLSDWQVIDQAKTSDGASFWGVIPVGLKQWADMAATRSQSPEPDQSRLVSTELRYERRELTPTIIDLHLTLDNLVGGFGISLESGLSQVLLCLDESACGGRFVRWQQQGETLGLVPIIGIAAGKELKVRISVRDNWGMVSVNDELLLTVANAVSGKGRLGILNYLQKGMSVTQLSVWGTREPERYPADLPTMGIGYRGFGASRPEVLYPENTILAGQQALSVRMDSVLYDLRITNDDVLVLMADDSLDRTTSCSGPVLEQTSSQVAACAIDDSSAYLGQDLAVPTLQQALTSFAKLDGPLYLMVPDSFDEVADRAMLRVLVDFLVAQNAIERVWLVAPNIETLKYARTLNGGMQGIWKVEAAGDTVLQLAGDSGLNGVAVADITLTSADIESAHTLGLVIWAWLADTTPRQQELMELGVDGIVTNRPDRLAGLGWSR